MEKVRENAHRAADRRGNPVASVTASAAPKRGVLSLRLSGRAGAAAAAAGWGPRA